MWEYRAANEPCSSEAARTGTVRDLLRVHAVLSGRSRVWASVDQRRPACPAHPGPPALQARRGG